MTDFLEPVELTPEEHAEIDELANRDYAMESKQAEGDSIRKVYEGVYPKPSEVAKYVCGCDFAAAKDEAIHEVPFIQVPYSTLCNLPDQLPGERIDLTIRQLIFDMQRTFLEVGGLLVDMYEHKLWTQTNYDRWKDYVESLGIGSYGFVQSLMGISKIVAQHFLTSGDVEEIGYSKACLLVPLANSGKLTPEIIDLARSAPNRDLRIAIGYKVPENDENSHVVCPECGATIRGAAYKRKDE